MNVPLDSLGGPPRPCISSRRATIEIEVTSGFALNEKFHQRPEQSRVEEGSRQACRSFLIGPVGALTPSGHLRLESVLIFSQLAIAIVPSCNHRIRDNATFGLYCRSIGGSAFQTWILNPGRRSGLSFSINVGQTFGSPILARNSIVPLGC